MPRFLALLLLAPLLVPVLAQDDDLPPDEVADLVDRYVDRGMDSLREGNYEEARLRFKKALRRDPKNRDAHLGTARCHALVGAYEKAEAQLQKLFAASPGDRAGLVMKAQIDLVHGRVGAVREAARTVIGSGGEGPDLIGLRARVLLAEALASRGRRDEARDVLDFFPEYYRRRYDTLSAADFDADRIRHDQAKARPLSEEMTLLAAALRHYAQLSPLEYDFANNASELLGSAKKLDPENWEAWIEWVKVTRVERERALARARKARDVVTKRNPELADLYVEVAKSLLTGWNSGEARAMIEAALQVNPKQTDGRAIMARIALEDNEYATASEHLDAGLAVNPNHRDLLALQATFELLHGRTDAFEAGMKKVLEIDKTYGEAYHLAGLVVATRQRRYDRAVELVRKGLAIDPANFQAHATIGIFLANQGRAEEALEALKKSRKLWPFTHPIRENFRVVLEYVTGTMTEVKTENFTIRIDPSEYEIMSRFLPELLEECWDDMVKRYDFTPRGPIRVEVFKKADDFSVRTIGLPGIPALGACFGGLITLDSPQALPPGQFLWASTARHEFSHVMSLQLSKGQVPRWFTEGLSVLEEKPLDTGWGMDAGYERQVFDAHATGTLPKIATFDAMFRGPRVAYAYYVGGLMLQFLQDHAGEKGIVEALRLYGEDRPMREVFQKAFQLKLEEFDQAFADYIGQRVRSYRIIPNFALLMPKLREAVLRNPADGESLIRIAWAFYVQRSYVDAGDYLARAQRQLGKDNPLVVLLSAHLTRHANRPERARALYESFFAAGGEDYNARMFLASYQAGAGEEDKYVESLQRAKAAWPVRAGGNSPYALLRRHYMSKGARDLALKELEQQARVLSRSIPLRLQLAREYTERKRRDDAIRVLEEALRVTLFDRNVHRSLRSLYRAAGATKKAVKAARCVVALRTDKDSDEEVAHMWLDLAETLIDDAATEEAKAAVGEAEKLVDAEAVPRVKAVRERLGQ